MRRSALGALRKFMDIRYRVPTHDRRTSFSVSSRWFFVTLLQIKEKKKKKNLRSPDPKVRKWEGGIGDGTQ